MAELSPWSAQALQYPDAGSSTELIYFEFREELETFLEPFIAYWVFNDGKEKLKYPKTPNISNTAPTSGGFLASFLKELEDALFNATPEKMDQRFRFDKEKPKDEQRPMPPQRPMYVPKSKSEPKLKRDPKPKPIKEDNKPQFGKNISIMDRMLNKLKSNIKIKPLPEYPMVGPENPINSMDQKNRNKPQKKDNMFPPGYHCKYAVAFGLTTEFNPSGIWIVQDLEESEY